MAYGNNPTYTQTNYTQTNSPAYAGYPDLNAQVTGEIQYFTNREQPFFNPVLTITQQPTNYCQPVQTNYQYPASTSTPLLPNVPLYTNSPSSIASQPMQNNYTVTTYTTHPTLPAYPSSLPAPMPPIYPPTSTAALQPLPPSTATLTVQQTQLPPYPSSAPTFYPIINSSRKIDIPSNLPFEQTVQKSEEVISAQIQSLKSSNRNWNSYETLLRETSAKEIIKQFASQYRAKFNETGAIDLNQIKINSSLLKGLLTANGQIDSLLDLNKLLLQEIFELGSEDMPFDAVRKKILEEVAIPQSEKKKSSIFDVFISKEAKEKAALQEAKVRENAASELKSKKLETIELAEQEWKALNHVYFVDIPKTIPTAPAITPTLPKKIYPQLPQATCEKYSVNNTNVPVLSWIDFAFANVTWNNLPEHIKELAILHVYGCPGIKGGAEEAAKIVYKGKNEELWTIYQGAKNNPSRSFSNDPFIIEAQKVLKFYYSDAFSWTECLERMRALPKDNTPFYGYVYEMANAANVDMKTWDEDHNFGKNHWDKPGIRKLAIQALERCLHTSSKG